VLFRNQAAPSLGHHATPNREIRGKRVMRLCCNLFSGDNAARHQLAVNVELPGIAMTVLQDNALSDRQSQPNR
jgi:hypothetical protein